MHGSAWAPSFADRATIRYFRKKLTRPMRRGYDDRVAEILISESKLAKDPVTLSHQVFAACVISSVEQWQSSGMDRSAAKSTVREAILGHGRQTKAIAVRLTGWFSRDPFTAFARYTEEQTPKAYGPTFEFGFEQDEAQFASVVHTCGYRTILPRHGAEDLIDLFCAWDMAWIEALPKSIQFERPTTLASGGNSCRFEFKRSKSRP